MSYNDPNENYTGVLIKKTFPNVLHIGSGSIVFDGTGSMIDISVENIISSSQTLFNSTQREFLYCGYLTG